MIRPYRSLFALPVALLATLLSVPVAHAQDVPPTPPPSTPPPPPPTEPPSLAPRYAPRYPSAYGAPAPQLPRRPGVEVRFEPENPELSLSVMSGQVPVQRLERYPHAWYIRRGLAPVYSPICNGPCTTELGAGTYRFAVSKDGGRPVPAGEAPIGGASTIHAEYEDHSGVRVAGVLVGVGGLIGGVAMIVVGAGAQHCDYDGYCHGDANGLLLGGGIGVLVVSAIVGAVMVGTHDEARIFVSPLTMPQVGSRKESLQLALDQAPAPQGLAFGVHF